METDIDALERMVSAMPPHVIETTEVSEETMKTSLSLLDQIIEKAEQENAAHKAAAIKNNKASQAVGESWMVFHLKALKDLLQGVK